MSKKKVNKVVDTPQESTIQYAGNVTLKFMRGDKVIKTQVYHNSCTLSMLYLICNAMAGYIDGKPQYMGIGKNNTNTNITDTGLHDEVAGYRVVVTSNSTTTKTQTTGTTTKPIGAQCILSAVFPYALLSGTKIGELGLFKTKSEQDLLARVTFATPIEIDDDNKGVSLYVE